jgi:glucose/mannose transport system substrate-binding protein
MNRKSKKFIKDFLIIGLVLLAIISISIIIVSTQQREKENILVIYHWWVSPGEYAAISALINVFVDKYPEVVVMPTSVISTSSAGGKNVLFDIMNKLIKKKETPDVFQGLAGYGVREYYDAGFLEKVDNVWESEGLEEVIPKTIQVMCQFDRHYYSVPVGVHRTNVVWYNKKILNKNGLNSGNITTWNAFFDACDKLKSSGIQYPIQMGAAWTAAHVFDQIIASQGINLYQGWVNGNLSSDDPRFLEAFKIFKRYLSYVNPDNADVSWDSATRRVIEGEGAFTIMGDWAEGEFKAAEMVYDEDYGTFVVPGTSKMYGLVIDTFHKPKYVPHSENSERWLEVVSSREGQDAFNPVKGSISARKDADVSKYDLYQQSAILEFITARYMFPAVSNGAPKTFELKEQEIIAQFIKDQDTGKAAKALADYMKQIKNQYTINWELK